MNNIIKTLLITLLLLVNACSEAPEPDEQNLPQTFRISDGIEVTMVAPAGFSLTQEHYGFVQRESFSRIQISEKEVPSETYLKSLTKENLLKNKLQLIEQSEIDIHGAICNQFKLRQNIAGSYYEKIWIIAGDQLSSIILEASYPEGSSNKHKQAIKESLLNFSVKTDANKRLFTGLPFELTETPEFTIKQRYANSIVLLPLSEAQKESSISISHGKTDKEIEDIQQLSEHFLINSQHYHHVDIMKNDMIKLDNMPALASSASVELNGVDTVVYQVVSYQKQQFLLIQAQMPREHSEKMIRQTNFLLKHFKFK